MLLWLLSKMEKEYPSEKRCEVRPDILKETDGPMLIQGLQSPYGSKIIVPRQPVFRADPELLERRW